MGGGKGGEEGDNVAARRWAVTGCRDRVCQMRETTVVDVDVDEDGERDAGVALGVWCV